MSNRDVELYHQMKTGDKQALERLYDKYEKLLYSFVIKLAGDQTIAEEVVQEVFIKLWTKKANYNDRKGKFSSWIVTITRYTAIDWIRKTKNQNFSLEEETDIPEEETSSTEDIIEWKEQGELVRRAIRTLSDEQKQMVELFYFKGQNQREIAEQCELPLGTVKGRIRLALQHLKKEISIGKGGKDDA
ncbi:sigma-70 family RNA polymerase sigma factor [Halobacillus salinarum]|uniref:Sigma-70 family RNA polymerase sigma factor n=1 Tax=Halobacillus salinarum TaxID=2932257 RepID=A0ABY4EQR0_9BACI|nr:sigma-70 family RNA polymerase sigma factor [Halobacillus salinarum]UOQ44441.1 sigma-70 family RNA polymerase sigma factor [Halobacillus salinarum]